MGTELNEDLIALIEWLQKNKLKLNTSKSVAMLITTSRVKKLQLINEHPQEKIELDGHILELSETVKYLGIIIGYLLTFKQHIEYTANKIAKKKKVGYLSRIGKYLTKWTKCTMYYYCP
jgi:hypothetical protein